MKKSIRKPRKASYYIGLAMVLLAFGAAALYLAIMEENKEYAEEASSYDDLAEQVQQDHSKPWVPSIPNEEEINDAIETALKNIEANPKKTDDNPDYVQTHPPDSALEQQGIDNPQVQPSQETPMISTYPIETAECTPKPTVKPGGKQSGQSSAQESDPMEDQTDTPAPTATPAPVIGYTGADLAACQTKNPDFIAWLKIPGTNVNYPVVLSDNTDFYLTHSFDGKKNKLGTLFSLGKTDYQTPGRNISIYGHHITNTSSGQLMFRPLLSYKDRSFYEKHSIIYMDSLYHASAYKIFAVINLVNGEWDVSTASFANDADFLAFVQQAQAESLYETDVEVNVDDKILTLITCDRSYAAKEGRLIVMAVEQ